MGKRKQNGNNEKTIHYWIKGKKVAIEYTCSICHTKATIYYAGQYKCRKCKRKYFVDKALNLIGENDEDEEDDVDTRTA